MNLLYNGAIGLYSLVARLASIKNEKVAKMIEGQRQTVHALRKAFGKNGCDVWIHAASLGEFEQARPLIERLKREQPDKKILLTFFSPSGYEVRKNYQYADCVAYLPFDTPSGVKDFMDAANPRMAVFVKYEFWGNYLQELRRRNVPAYIISAIFRPSQPFFRRWGGMFRDMLDCFTHLYVQDEDSRQLLDGIGVRNVTVNGDTRFDRVTDVMASTFDIPAVGRFMQEASMAFIAGSSWPEDEKIYVPWLNRHASDGVRAIIAPHEFDEERLGALLSEFGGDAVLLSSVEENAEVPAGKRVIVVDSFGKLSSLYRYGSLAYIGGGFGAGIHNINEAAVYGMPIVFGPKYSKFKEARDLIAIGGASSVNDSSGCSKVLDTYLSNKALVEDASRLTADYIKRNIGATDKIFRDLFSSQHKTKS